VTEPRQSIGSLLKEAISGSEQDFGRLELSRAIPLLAIPMVLEMALEAVFAVADVFFVARLGAGAIATVGLTESVVTLIYALAIGISIPVTAMVSRRFGEGSREAASRAGGQALLVALCIGVGLGVPGVWLADDVLRMMGASAEVVAQGRGYAMVTFATNVVIVLLFVLNAVFRGAGDAARAMRALWIANALNLVLDPCLIFGLGPFPELGLTGAAIATAIGRGVGVLYQLRVLTRGPRIRIDLGALRPDFALIGKILRLSVGSTSQYLVSTASWVVLVRILASFGAEVVAGYTVAMRIVMFALMPSWGFSNATATLVGQSLGAGDPSRAERAVLLSGLYNMGFLGVVSLLLIAMPEAVAGLLSDDPAVLRWAAEALFIISFGYVFYAWEMVLINAFNGAGDTRTPLRINLVAFWLVELPLGYGLAHWAGLGPTGVFIAVALAYSLAAVIAYVAFRGGRWKHVDL